MLKFSASVLSGETPVNDVVTLMSAETSRYHLVADSTHWLLKIGSANCRYWSVLQALGDAPCFGWLEIVRAELVSVEIVQHQPYRLCVRVCLVKSHLI